MNDILALFFTSIGAFFYWLVKGMKSSFNNESSGMYDRDFKFFRNLFTGVFFFILFVYGLVYIFQAS